MSQDFARDEGEDADILPSGTKLGDCRVERLLERRASSLVYAAQDLRASDTVSIEEYFPRALVLRASDLSVSSKTAGGRGEYLAGLAAFRSAAQALVGVRHPNLARIRGLVEAHGTLYALRDGTKGTSLAQRLSGARLSGDAAATLLAGLLDALAALRDHGVSLGGLAGTDVVVREDGTPVIGPLVLAGERPEGEGQAGSPASDLGTLLYRGVTGRAFGPEAGLAAEAARGHFAPRLLDLIDRLCAARDGLSPAALDEMRAEARSLVPTRPVAQPLAAQARDDESERDPAPAAAPAAGRGMLGLVAAAVVLILVVAGGSYWFLAGGHGPDRGAPAEQVAAAPPVAAPPVAPAPRAAVPPPVAQTQPAPQSPAPAPAPAPRPAPAAPQPAPAPAPPPPVAAAPQAAPPPAPPPVSPPAPEPQVPAPEPARPASTPNVGPSTAPPPAAPVASPGASPPTTAAPAPPLPAAPSVASGPSSPPSAAAPEQGSARSASPAPMPPAPAPLPPAPPAESASPPAPPAPSAPVAIAPPPPVVSGPPPARPAPGTTFQDCPTCPIMTVVPSGMFDMGSASGAATERPVHRVTLAARFAIGQSPVTFAEWDACAAAGGCGFRPSDHGWGRGDRPVIGLSWSDAQSYVDWLSKTTGQRYRLPSEAEWEYAARGGTATAWWWGDEAGMGHADCADCESPPLRMTVPVRSYAPNPFGLYDTAGNVAEWVADCWAADYTGAPGDGSPVSTGTCAQHVLRGGNFASDVRSLRSAARFKYDTNVRYYTNGLRVARNLD